jgi:hypothetical protein
MRQAQDERERSIHPRAKNGRRALPPGRAAAVSVGVTAPDRAGERLGVDARARDLPGGAQAPRVPVRHGWSLPLIAE